MNGHLSYSQMSQLRKCGESFRLSRVEGLPQRPSIPQIFGKIFHTVSEDVDRSIHTGSPDGARVAHAAKALATVEWQRESALAEKSYGPEETWLVYGRQDVAKWQTEILPRAIDAYIKWRLVDRPELKLAVLPDFGPAIEVPFEIDLDGIPIRGFIDRVFVGDNGVPLVLDLKSGRKPETDEQLAIYRLALEAMFGGDFRWGAYLYDIKSGEAKFAGPYNVAHWTRDKLAKVYRMAKTQVEHGIFLPAPGEYCHHCSVNEHCEYVLSRT